MNPLKNAIRLSAATLISAALIATSVVPAQAAPRDNKNDLLSASATLASQAKTALSVTGGSNDSCKPWNTNADYSKAALNSINFVRGLAGVPNVSSNAALTTYAKSKQNYNCTAPNPGYAITSLSYELLPGDPGGVRAALGKSALYRAALLSTSTKYAAVGHSGDTYNGKAVEGSYLSSTSSNDYLWYFNKAVAWPAAGFNPVELTNGIWSYYGSTGGDTNTRPRFSDATISVKNSAGKALAVEKLQAGGWYSDSDELHFKVPAATVGNTKGNEASYTVTIAGAFNYTGTYNAKKTLPNITYTVKLVRTGASFEYTAVAPKVTKQPVKKLSVKVNKYINVSAGVFVPGQQEVKYQWQFKRKGESKWNTIWGATKTSASVTPNGLSLNGSVLRLRAESAGKTVYTNNISLKVTKYASSVKITKATLKRGKKPVVTVKASQTGKVKVTAVKGKTKITKTVSVKKNKSTKVTLPKAISKTSSGKGKWKVTVKFTPKSSSLYASSSKSLTVKVK